MSLDFAEPLVLKDAAYVSVFRGSRGYYLIEPDEVPQAVDLIVNNGRIYLAQRASAGDTVASKMNYMAVGTAVAAPALTDTTLPGEIRRKALAVYSANPNNVIMAVSTFGGFAETIQSIAITEAGIFNHASSGLGTMKARVTFASVTLADSDILRVEHLTNVGSNTI